MKNIRQANISIHRDSWVEINLESLAHNIKELKKNIPAGKKVLAVVKADAYGHGAVMLAPTLLASGCDMLGVASVDEGLDLRNAKINSEILVLGAIPVWAIENAVYSNISFAIFSEEHLCACKQIFERTGIKPKVHIKLDTGMNRIGVKPLDAVEFIKNVQNSDFVELKGIFTHFYEAEKFENAQKQIDIWTSVISKINTSGLILHAQNTTGSLCYEVPYTNMVRLGIGLYGLQPDYPIKEFIKPNLKPILSLKGRIVHIHEIQSGEGVSYSHTFTASKPTRIATIPIGYADGVSRALSNKIKAVWNCKKITQVGNITMDQMMFDIGDYDAKIGDIITLIGENSMSIDDWAKILNTINYELTCRLKVRLPRVYTR